MVITHCFFEMENYYMGSGQLTTGYTLADCRVLWLITGYSIWNSKSLINNVNLCRKQRYDVNMAPNIVYLHTKFHWDG